MMSVLAWSPDTVWLFLQKAWWFLVVLGVLVAFHELGHFLAARWVGVKVLKFSTWFRSEIIRPPNGRNRISPLCHSARWLCQVVR